MAFAKLLTVKPALAAFLALAGCGGLDSITAPSADSPLGIALRGTAEEPQEINLDDFKKRSFCPQVTVRDGTQTHRIFARGEEGNPRKLIYQVTIDKTARECQRSGENLYIKVGIAGRIIPGPIGKAGKLSIPLRVAVLGDGEAPVYSKLHKIDVLVESPTQASVWTKIDTEVIVPFTTELVVYAGFDAGAKKRR